MIYLQFHLRNFVVFVVFLLSVFSTAIAKSNERIDSLKAELAIAKEDSFKVALLNDLSAKIGWEVGNYDTSLVLSNQAKLLAEKLNFKMGLASAHGNIASAYIYQGKLSEALENYTIALKLYKELGHKNGIASTYNNIANVYISRGDFEEALDYLDYSLKIKIEIGDSIGMSSSYSNIASVLLYQVNYPEALKNYNLALDISKSIGNTRRVISSLYNLGNIYFLISNFSVALDYYYQALKLIDKNVDMKILSAIYSSIGNIKNSQKDDPKALEYYFLSLEMDKKMGANEGIAINYKNIGDVYLSQKKYEDALSYFSKTLDIRQNMGDKKSIPSLYNSIGAVYSELKNYNKSREYYDKVIESAYSNKSSLFVSYTNISEGFLNQNMLIDAKSWADKALGIAKEIGEDIENFEKIYQLLSQIQHLQGNYLDAYENYKQYILYRDSLYNEENTKKIVETEMLYEFDKKEIATQASFQKSQDSLKLVQQKAIELQQLENEYQSKYALAKNNEERLQLLYEEDLKRQEIENNFQQQQIKNNASQKKNQAIKQAEYEKELLIQASKRRNSILILSSISALLLLSGGFVYWRFQTKKKEAQRLDVKNQKIETLVKELHHRVKNNMQIISSLLSLQSSKTDSADVKEAFHDGINRVQAMGLIHQKLYMSEDITQVNMKEYIESLSENLISSYAISGRSVKLQKDLKDISLNIDTAVPLGLILNELLTNALKYGTTNTLPEISISFDGSLLIIKDNGIKNFHPDQHRDSNSFGLKLIQILCKQIRAQLTYYQNNGTECRIKLGV